MCVKKNPRVRDSALIAGESTALGVDNSYISLGLSMIAFRLWRGLCQLVSGHTAASSSNSHAHLQGSASALASLPQQIWERIILHIPFRGSCHRHSTCQGSRILCCWLIAMLKEWLTISMYRALNINNLCREQFSVFWFIFIRLYGTVYGMRPRLVKRLSNLDSANLKTYNCFDFWVFSQMFQLSSFFWG